MHGSERGWWVSNDKIWCLPLEKEQPQARLIGVTMEDHGGDEDLFPWALWAVCDIMLLDHCEWWKIFEISWWRRQCEDLYDAHSDSYDEDKVGNVWALNMCVVNMHSTLCKMCDWCMLSFVWHKVQRSRSRSRSRVMKPHFWTPCYKCKTKNWVGKMCDHTCGEPWNVYVRLMMLKWGNHMFQGTGNYTWCRFLGSW